MEWEKGGEEKYVSVKESMCVCVSGGGGGGRVVPRVLAAWLRVA